MPWLIWAALHFRKAWHTSQQPWDHPELQLGHCQPLPNPIVSTVVITVLMHQITFSPSYNGLPFSKFYSVCERYLKMSFVSHNIFNTLKHFYTAEAGNLRCLQYLTCTHSCQEVWSFPQAILCSYAGRILSTICRLALLPKRLCMQQWLIKIRIYSKMQ